MAIDKNSLFNLIESDNDSRNNLELFLDTYNLDNTVSFTGAGVSKSLGIVDWKELLKKLLNNCNESDLEKELPEINNDITNKIIKKMEYDKTNLKKAFEDYINNNNEDPLPEIARVIENVLKDRIKINEFIKKELLPKHNSSTLSLVKMIEVINTHLTTNYDKSIESAYNFRKLFYEINDITPKNKECIISRLPDFNYPLSNILYLHGNIDDKLYILTSDDYNNFYPSVKNINNNQESRELEKCIEYYFKHKNILFVGFSFADVYVTKFIKIIVDRLQKEIISNTQFYERNGKNYNIKKYKHFLLMKNTENNFNFADMYIYPILYKEHIFIEYLFEYLIEQNKFLEKKRD